MTARRARSDHVESAVLFHGVDPGGYGGPKKSEAQQRAFVQSYVIVTGLAQTAERCFGHDAADARIVRRGFQGDTRAHRNTELEHCLYGKSGFELIDDILTSPRSRQP